MIAFFKNLAASGLLALSTLAQAGQHAICYETPSVNGKLTGIAACHEDAGGSCSLRPLSAGMNVTGQWLPNAPPGSYQSYTMQGSAGTFDIRITFTDAQGTQTQRDCEINARGANFGDPGYGSIGAELTGFMTDASGLLSTAVWRLRSVEVSNTRRQTVMVPGDFVAVGGGVQGTDKPYGALVVESYQPDALGGAPAVCDWRCWSTRTADLGVSDPHIAISYVIGMRISGMKAHDLKSQLRVHTPPATRRMERIASNQALVPSGQMMGGSTVVLSGSVKAHADHSNSVLRLGQYVTVSAPILQESYPGCTEFGDCKPGMPAQGWRVESVDHDFYHPGYVDTAVLGLPSTLIVQGRTWSLHSVSAAAAMGPAQQPSVDVGRLPEGYALTGIGAQVDWCCQRYPRLKNPVGNLLWNLEPRTDLGASVASKHHLLYNPAMLTGFALGLRMQ